VRYSKGMKNPSVFLAALLLPLCALPGHAANDWDDARAIDPASFHVEVRGQAPCGDAETVGCPASSGGAEIAGHAGPIDESNGPAFYFAHARPFSRDDEGFSALTGRSWHCWLEQDGNLWNGGGGGVRIPYPIVGSRVTFSPRDRGLRRGAARAESSSGVVLFSFSAGEGYGGSLADAQGRTLVTEQLRLDYRVSDRGQDHYGLVSRSVDASGRVRYWRCQSEPYEGALP
jgi:hypothetical protein